MMVKNILYHIAGTYCWHIVAILMTIAGIIFELRDERFRANLCFSLGFIFAYFIHIF